MERITITIETSLADQVRKVQEEEHRGSFSNALTHLAITGLEAKRQQKKEA